LQLDLSYWQACETSPRLDERAVEAAALMCE
jgi:hypothetical protein